MKLNNKLNTFFKNNSTIIIVLVIFIFFFNKIKEIWNGLTGAFSNVTEGAKKLFDKIFTWNSIPEMLSDIDNKTPYSTSYYLQFPQFDKNTDSDLIAASLKDIKQGFDYGILSFVFKQAKMYQAFGKIKSLAELSYWSKLFKDYYGISLREHLFTGKNDSNLSLNEFISLSNQLSKLKIK